MTIEIYLSLLPNVAESDVAALHAAFWDYDTDALALIAVRYEVAA